MRCLRGLVIALTATIASPLPGVAEACIPPDGAALLLLDASYSMLANVAGVGKTRFTVAREALVSLVDRFPPDGHLALRFLGSDSQATRKDCVDTRLAVPFAPAVVNRGPIKLALAQAHAHGVTPLAFALGQAVNDFADEGRSRLIIVVSDGADTCGGNPCAVAAAIAAQGFVVDTVGFLVDKASRLQLQCVARAAHGNYVEVPSALQLSDKLSELLAECLIATLPSDQRRHDLGVAVLPWAAASGLPTGSSIRIRADQVIE